MAPVAGSGPAVSADCAATCDATIALIKSTSVAPGARLAVTSGATTLCVDLVPRSVKVVLMACAKASAFVFNQVIIILVI